MGVVFCGDERSSRHTRFQSSENFLLFVQLLLLADKMVKTILPMVVVLVLFALQYGVDGCMDVRVKRTMTLVPPNAGNPTVGSCGCNKAVEKCHCNAFSDVNCIQMSQACFYTTGCGCVDANGNLKSKVTLPKDYDDSDTCSDWKDFGDCTHAEYGEYMSTCCHATCDSYSSSHANRENTNPTCVGPVCSDPPSGSDPPNCCKYLPTDQEDEL